MKPYRPMLGPFRQQLPPGEVPTAPPRARPPKSTASKPSAPPPSSHLLGTCPKGHALTSQNSYLTTRNVRTCCLCNPF